MYEPRGKSETSVLLVLLVLLVICVRDGVCVCVKMRKEEDKKVNVTERERKVFYFTWMNARSGDGIISLPVSQDE